MRVRGQRGCLQRSGGLYFLALNQYSIRDKTIPAGQNADFGGFLRSKAGSAGRFSGSVPVHWYSHQ